MRFLHTSDWHLGRTLHGAPLLSEQQEMVSTIVDITRETQVDAVVIAGDLFDRAIPAVEATELWDHAVSQLRATGAAVIAISGNHDSARRVSVHGDLLELAGVAIRGAIDRCDQPVIVRPLNGSDPVPFYALPYLDPVVARGVFGEAAYEVEPTEASDSTASEDGQAPRRRVTHRSVTLAAMNRIREDLTKRGTPRSVVVSHCFVTGGESSDSERNITLGNLENVPLATFEGISYVALGHLHGPQGFEDGRVAYSGSPLPYSFSEQHHDKSVRLIELGSTGKSKVEVISLNPSMKLVTLTGTVDGLLTDQDLRVHEQSYVRFRLTDRHLPDQPMLRLRSKFPKALELTHTPPGSAEDKDGNGATVITDLDNTSPVDLTLEFFRSQENRDAYADESALLVQAIQTVQVSGGEV